MSLIAAIRELGRNEFKKNNDTTFSDIDSFIQMPTDVIDFSAIDNPTTKVLPAKEIRIHLNVENPNSEQLNVLGILKIDTAYFWHGDEDDRTKKRRYLHREPQGKAAQWRFSPLYKLGKGMLKNGKDALIGENGDWRCNKETRFYKLMNSTLNAFEKEGTLSEGSVERIMTELESQVTAITDLWNDKKSSYLLVFSVADNGIFRYPVDVPAFLSYFKKKLKEVRETPTKSKTKISNTNESMCCSMCGTKTNELVNFDKIFAFSTFDKKSFLPGLSIDLKLSVFPICQDCNQLLSEGRNAVDKIFLDVKSLPGTRIYVIPELLFGKISLGKISDKTSDFIQHGLCSESFLSKIIISQDDELIFHFVFWEKNQAQERVHYIVEDVPPSRLRRLERLWNESCVLSKLNDRQANSSSDLSGAIFKIYRTFLSLAGLRENDKTVMNELVLKIIAALLSGRKIDVYQIKKVFVSYLFTLCADREWIRKNSQFFARDIECIVDFLYRVDEEDN